MYKAGHLIRRSSVRIKSLSGGHSHLLMIISQIREVRTTFKSFLAAQAILSEDLLKWSCSVDNEVIHETFSYLAELSSLWTDVQKDFVDNLKHFRSNFDMILEGERHVDQAKQVYVTKEETESDLRRELQKSYKRGTVDEINVLRERLKKAEKLKEVAHYEVVDRLRENEAVRMIRVKEGMRKYGESFTEMIHKGDAIFNAQRKVVNELPDVHDKALHSMKYRGHVCAKFVQEAKEHTRLYRRTPPSSSSSSSTEIVENKNPFFDPPPPYTLSPDHRMNALTLNLSTSSLHEDDKSSKPRRPSAPVPVPVTSSPSSSTVPVPVTSSSSAIYPSLDSSHREDLNNFSVIDGSGATGISSPSAQTRVVGATIDNDSLLIHPQLQPDTKPSLLPLKATRLKKKYRKSWSPSLQEGTHGHGCNNVSTNAISHRSGGGSQSSIDEVVPNVPPPYNPFYEWSAFPPSDK